MMTGLMVHLEIGRVTVSWKEGPDSAASKLGCGGIANAGCGIALGNSRTVTCPGCLKYLSERGQ